MEPWQKTKELEPWQTEIAEKSGHTWCVCGRNFTERSQPCWSCYEDRIAELEAKVSDLTVLSRRLFRAWEVESAFHYNYALESRNHQPMMDGFFATAEQVIGEKNQRIAELCAEVERLKSEVDRLEAFYEEARQRQLDRVFEAD